MKIDQLSLLILPILFILISACDPKNNDEVSEIVIPSGPREICETNSIWRNHNVPDSCSFYSEDQRCKVIQGHMRIIANLYRGALEEEVFEGTLSSRWFEIEESQIRYYKPNGDLADEGECSCKNGTLTIRWKERYHRPMQYLIYFNSKDTVELRYLDYPFSLKTFQYDSTKRANNQTKILGIMER